VNALQEEGHVEISVSVSAVATIPPIMQAFIKLGD
jgi:hypothetical protein